MEKHWILSMAVWENAAGHYGFKNVPAEGGTPIEAFLRVKEENKEDPYWATAFVLLNAWPCTKKQAEELS